MAEEEALNLLKTFYRDGKMDKIKVVGSDIVFDDVKFPKTTKISHFGDKTHTLHSIFHFLKYYNPAKKSIATNQAYFLEGKEQGFTFVRTGDAQKVFEFIVSEVPTSNETIIPGLNASGLPPKRARESEMPSDQPKKKVMSSSELLQPVELTDDLKHSKDAFIRMIECKNKTKEEEEEKNETTENNNNNNVDEVLYINTTKDLTKSIMSREKSFQNRNSILLSNTKNFQGVLDVVKATIREFEMKEKKKIDDQRKRRDSGYDRYNTSTSNIVEIDQIKIDTMGSFSGLPGLSSSISRPSSSSLPSSSSSSSRPSPSSSSSSSSSSRSRKEVVPIIIVPSAVTSLININNVKEFIENGVLNVNEKVNITNKPSSVLVIRKSGGRDHFYNVVDNPAKLKEPDWDKVIAVFALGADWQFKNWHPNWRSAVDVFTKSKGFFVTYDDTPIPAKIASWDVRVLKVNRHQAHTVKQAQLAFWDILEKYQSDHKKKTSSQSAR